MGETRVDLEHLLEDLRDAYPSSLEETILTEIIANSLDSGAGRIVMTADPAPSPSLWLPHAVEAAQEHAFITRFLTHWSHALEQPQGRRRGRRY